MLLYFAFSSLLPRIHPVFHCLQHRKWETGWYLSTCNRQNQWLKISVFHALFNQLHTQHFVYMTVTSFLLDMCAELPRIFARLPVLSPSVLMYNNTFLPFFAILMSHMRKDTRLSTAYLYYEWQKAGRGTRLAYFILELIGLAGYSWTEVSWF